MAMRAIDMERNYNYADKNLLVGPNSAVIFNQLVDNWYLNAQCQISYDWTNGIFQLAATQATENHLFISWAVSLKTGLSTNYPVFGIELSDINNQVIANYPVSGVKKTSVLAGTTYIHLTAPELASSEIQYRISLKNQSDSDCFYCDNVYAIASILIVSFPDTI